MTREAKLRKVRLMLASARGIGCVDFGGVSSGVRSRGREREQTVVSAEGVIA